VVLRVLADLLVGKAKEAEKTENGRKECIIATPSRCFLFFVFLQLLYTLALGASAPNPSTGPSKPSPSGSCLSAKSDSRCRVGGMPSASALASAEADRRAVPSRKSPSDGCNLLNKAIHPTVEASLHRRKERKKEGITW
jgi:hypothetical protein